MQSSIILTRLALRSKAMVSRRSYIVNYTAHRYPAFQSSAFSSGKYVRVSFFLCREKDEFFVQLMIVVTRDS
jgi:hypothetical protein